MRLLVLACALAACRSTPHDSPGATPPPAGPRSIVAARLDDLHAIAAAATAAPPVRATLPLARAIARPTDRRDADNWMLVDLAWIAAPDFREPDAHDSVPSGDGLGTILASLRAHTPAADARLAELAPDLAGMRWVAVVRVYAHTDVPPHSDGDVMIFDAATHALLGGFPFAFDGDDRDRINFTFQLETDLEPRAFAYASGR